MNRKRVVLYAIFALYQIGAFIFTVMVDGNMDLLGLLKYIPYFKYISFLGLILIAIDIIWAFSERKKKERQEGRTSEMKPHYDINEEGTKTHASRQA